MGRRLWRQRTARQAIRRGLAVTISPPAPRDSPAGLDYRLTPSTVVGLALAGGGTSWSLANGLGGGKSDAFQAGVYGATRWGAAYVAAALSFTNHWMSTDRFAFAGDHLTASFNAQSFGARVESGYRFATIVRRADALCRHPGAELPHPGLQRDRRQRRRLRACLCRSHRHRHQERAGRALRPPAGAQSQRRAHAAGAARLGARLGERPERSRPRSRRFRARASSSTARRRRRTPRSPRPAPSFASPTASRCSASSTASSRAAPPPMPALVPSDIRGEASAPCPGRSAATQISLRNLRTLDCVVMRCRHRDRYTHRTSRARTSTEFLAVPDQRCTTRASSFALHRIRDTQLAYSASSSDQVAPVRIEFIHQRDFPRSSPALERRFARPSFQHGRIFFVIDEQDDAIRFGESRHQLGLVLGEASNEVVGHTDIRTPRGPLVRI